MAITINRHESTVCIDISLADRATFETWLREEARSPRRSVLQATNGMVIFDTRLRLKAVRTHAEIEIQCSQELLVDLAGQLELHIADTKTRGMDYWLETEGFSFSPAKVKDVVFDTVDESAVE